MSEAEKAILAVMEKHGLSIKSEFVPFSKSRNASRDDMDGKPWLSLNWKVTLQRNGRDVLTTDYGAGVAHCPSYNKPVPANWERSKRAWQPMITEWECENGFEAETRGWGYSIDFKKKLFRSPPVPGGEVERMLPRAILPDPAAVIASLILDSSVLDSGGFEEWAEELGYDTDSRKAESIYRACLEIALKLRAGIGEDAMSELREACQDY